jgi:putative toxin-antitoxin system antitoxin component (TIGR02293 family)
MSYFSRVKNKHQHTGQSAATLLQRFLKPKKSPQASLVHDEGEAFYATAAVPDIFDLINSARQGLPKEHLFAVAALYNVSLEELSSWLHCSYRNLQRKPDDEPLDAPKSERLLELTLLAQRGEDVLGSGRAFQQWLRAPLLALGQQPPMALLGSSLGIQQLQHVLGRLEWGVFG